MSSGIRQPDGLSAMTARSCDIAVSEMTGFPLESICGYAVIVLRHVPMGHETNVFQGPGGQDDEDWLARILEATAADVRSAL